MPDDGDIDNLDELLDKLPKGLARKVAKHLNGDSDPEPPEEAPGEPWEPLPPPPEGLLPEPFLRLYDYSHRRPKPKPPPKHWWQWKL